MNNSDQKQNSKQNRKPRVTNGSRNFFCGCNKAYLSYPALYTHVKNKHDGEFPIGSNSKQFFPQKLIPDSE